MIFFFFLEEALFEGSYEFNVYTRGDKQLWDEITPVILLKKTSRLFMQIQNL